MGGRRSDDAGQGRAVRTARKPASAVRRLSARDFTSGVDAIRSLAAAYGLIPVVRLAEALERAVFENERACPTALYLGRLHDAIGCDRLDEQASQAMLASVSVRLGA